MSDYSGFRTVYTLGEETEAMRAASYAVMNKTRANRSRVNSTRRGLTSMQKNIATNGAISVGNTISSSIKRLQPYKFITISSKGYMFSKPPIGQIIKKWGSRLGYAGIAYGVYDAGEDIVKGKIMGGLIDAASCGISALAGYGIGVGAAAIIGKLALVGLPALGITGVAIGVATVTSIGVTYVAESVKEWWYRRKKE